jgi:N-acetylmuramoyl-L-alanine amidase/PKD repeat protein
MTLRICIVIFNLLFLAFYGSAQLNGIRICIDPGHGGYDPANDRKIELPYGLIFWESEGNLMTANHSKELLTQLGADVKVTRTDNSDASDISLSARSTIANEFGADFFLSNHTNAGGGGNNYSLVLFKGEDNNPAWPLAKVFGSYLAPGLQDLLRTTNYYNRGDLSFLAYNLGVLKNTNMPAALSEGSFHDLNEEAFRLKNSEYSRNYAWAISRAFCTYFNVSGFPTGRVGGIVTDRITGQILNNIHAVLNPGDLHYYGDEFYNGFYAIGDIVPGSYQLTLSRSGYIPVTIQVNIEGNKYSEIDITLPPDNNGTPYADFDIIGLPAGAGDEVVFDAKKSADNIRIEKYEWNFGDGTEADTGKIVKHIFTGDGTYNVSLKVTDNEQNTSSITKIVLIKTLLPEPPVILSAQYKKSDNTVTIKWKSISQSGIAGYRIYYKDQFSDDFKILADTNILKKNSFQYIFDSPKPDHQYSYKISALSRSGTESSTGNIYGVLLNSDVNNKRILVVDGFHRKSSFTGSTQDFTANTYIRGLYDADIFADVSSCSNESIISGDIDLNTFHAVIWYLGDESTADETFSTAEQIKLKEFLNGGGKLFVTGSEIAWDLDYKGLASDKSFFHDYLKALYLEDGASGRSPATGDSESEFSGIKLTYGIVYPEDFPDVISTSGGSHIIMKYNQGSSAGIAYKGPFADNSAIGAVVNIGFPLETVQDKDEIKHFFKKLMRYFDFTVSTDEIITDNQQYIIYPSIFNDKITVETKEPDEEKIHVSIFNVSGQLIFDDNVQIRNSYEINTTNYKPGFYLLKLIQKTKSVTYKLVKY